MTAPSADRRAQAVLGLLGDEPISTSELYDRAGYALLMRLGLIEYRAFRETLAGLAAGGLAEYRTEEEGATLWWRA